MASTRPPLRERAERRHELPPLHGGTRPPLEPQRVRRRWPRLVAIALGALVFGFLSGFALRGSGPQLATTGPPPDAHLGALAADELLFRISSDLPSLMGSATLDYDGADVRDQAFIGDGELTYRPRDLSEGTHRLEFSMHQPFVPWPVRRSWIFTVDHTKPVLTITGPTLPAERGAPVTLSGRVNEIARVTIDDTPVEVAEDGTFALTFPQPPAAAVTVRAIDRAGNSRGVRTAIPLAPRPPIQPTRAVHVTAIAWDTPSLREPVLAMLRSGQINAIQLDLKDESGVVGYDSQIPLAREIGAVDQSYVLRDAVARIHALGGRVVGRIVAFRDPILARYAWENGDRDQVIQAPGGGLYTAYGGFTNFAHPAVRAYNMDIATEAARAGVDDILYDYIRRPDGPLETMVFPGLRGGAQASIVSFLAEARQALEPTGTFLGASLFGIAAFRPEDVAQDVTRIARNVDYVAPLIYPSHWGKGIYDIAEPETEPQKIIEKSLDHFNALVEGSGARVVPWLQDFTISIPYGAEEVCAQVRGAHNRGVEEWIMWNAYVEYTRAGCLKG